MKSKALTDQFLSPVVLRAWLQKSYTVSLQLRFRWNWNETWCALLEVRRAVRSPLTFFIDKVFQATEIVLMWCFLSPMPFSVDGCVWNSKEIPALSEILSLSDTNNHPCYERGHWAHVFASFSCLSCVCTIWCTALLPRDLLATNVLQMFAI